MGEALRDLPTEPELRYVVLRHEGVPDPHFDLMFETAPGSALATWRSPQWPPAEGVQLAHLPDHRPAYLTYEGPVSQGRGVVRRVAAGGHTVLLDEPAELRVRLDDGIVVRLVRRANA